MVDLGAVEDEAADDALAAVLGGDQEDRVAVHVLGVDVGAVIDEGERFVDVAPQHGREQGLGVGVCGGDEDGRVRHRLADRFAADGRPRPGAAAGQLAQKKTCEKSQRQIRISYFH